MPPSLCSRQTQSTPCWPVARPKVGSYTPKAWQELKVEFDCAAKTYSVFLNGKQIANSLPWNDPKLDSVASLQIVAGAMRWISVDPGPLFGKPHHFPKVTCEPALLLSSPHWRPGPRLHPRRASHRPDHHGYPCGPFGPDGGKPQRQPSFLQQPGPDRRHPGAGAHVRDRAGYLRLGRLLSVRPFHAHPARRKRRCLVRRRLRLQRRHRSVNWTPTTINLASGTASVSGTTLSQVLKHSSFKQIAIRTENYFTQGTGDSQISSLPSSAGTSPTGPASLPLFQITFNGTGAAPITLPLHDPVRRGHRPAGLRHPVHAPPARPASAAARSTPSGSISSRRRPRACFRRRTSPHCA